MGLAHVPFRSTAFSQGTDQSYPSPRSLADTAQGRQLVKRAVPFQVASLFSPRSLHSQSLQAAALQGGSYWQPKIQMFDGELTVDWQLLIHDMLAKTCLVFCPTSQAIFIPTQRADMGFLQQRCSMLQRGSAISADVARLKTAEGFCEVYEGGVSLKSCILFMDICNFHSRTLFPRKLQLKPAQLTWCNACAPGIKVSQLHDRDQFEA